MDKAAHFLKFVFHRHLLLAISRKIDDGYFILDVINDYNKLALGSYKDPYTLDEKYFQDIRKLVLRIWGKVPKEPDYKLLIDLWKIFNPKDWDLAVTEHFTNIKEMLK